MLPPPVRASESVDIPVSHGNFKTLKPPFGLLEHSNLIANRIVGLLGKPAFFYPVPWPQ